MTRPAASASTPLSGVSSALGVAGLLCLALITLVSPGATRMFAWPWSLAYAGALLAPALALIVRAADARRPLLLPPLAWRIIAATTAATVLLSALASPYRGPSLQWSAPLLAAVAVFFVAYDALHSNPGHSDHPAALDHPVHPTPLDHRIRLARVEFFIALAFALIVLTSIALWLPTIAGRSLEQIALARNGYPLGHSNYTAALALLAGPWLAVLARRTRGLARAAWIILLGLAFVMFLTSGSRAGMAGLAAAVFAALLLSPLAAKKKLALTAALVVAGLLLVVAHPRTRAMLFSSAPAASGTSTAAAEPNLSNVQRSAMLVAAARLGVDRPLLGWGPGTTPLAYPRYRAGLDGGAENVLQLHSTPAQLWAEFGAAGLACALAFAALVLLNLSRHLLAAVALIGYAVFSVGDWQLDIPIFGFALALFVALLAPPATSSSTPASSPLRLTFLLAPLLTLAAIILLGHPDPTPEFNVRALTLARDPARAPEAIALLRNSLTQNPNQEIAHFNLGWLLLVRDPADAERHFLAAARLVPDKGGVYFGLGLARLNQNHPAEAARALALECLNDPRFLTSPWWLDPALAPLLPAVRTEFTRLLTLAQPQLPPSSWAAQQAALLLRAPFPALTPGLTYRRERTAYPVLMRNLDLPPPTDLYDARDSSTPTTLPPKSWLPSPLLLELLTPAPTRRQ